MSALSDKFVSFWELDEESGTRFDKVTASANDLTDNNTVTRAVGKVGNAAQFTRANSESLSHANNASLSTGDINLTICAWVYMDAKPAGSPAIMKIVEPDYDGTGGVTFDYRNDADDRFRCEWLDGAGGQAAFVAANDFGSPSAATWYFVVAQFDPVANTAYISVNNGKVTSAAQTAPHGDGMAGGAGRTPRRILLWRPTSR